MMWPMAGFEESLVSPAKRDQNEMGGLQNERLSKIGKRDQTWWKSPKTWETRLKWDPGTPYIFCSGPTKIKAAAAPIVKYWYAHNLHGDIVCMINNLFSCDRKTLPVTFAAFIYNFDCLTPPGAASAPKRHGDEEAAMIGRFSDFQNLNSETHD